MKRRTLMTSALGLFLAPHQLFKLCDGKLLPADEALANSAGKNPKLVTMYFPNGCNPDYRAILKGVGIDAATLGEPEFNNTKAALPKILVNG